MAQLNMLDAFLFTAVFLLVLRVLGVAARR
jgi:hypothetical protein